MLWHWVPTGVMVTKMEGVKTTTTLQIPMVKIRDRIRMFGCRVQKGAMWIMQMEGRKTRSKRMVRKKRKPQLSTGPSSDVASSTMQRVTLKAWLDKTDLRVLVLLQ